jgi:hypothetical protein
MTYSLLSVHIHKLTVPEWLDYEAAEADMYCPGCNDERPQVSQDARSHTCGKLSKVEPADALIISIVQPRALERPLSDNTDDDDTDLDLETLPF